MSDEKQHSEHLMCWLHPNERMMEDARTRILFCRRCDQGVHDQFEASDAALLNSLSQRLRDAETALAERDVLLAALARAVEWDGPYRDMKAETAYFGLERVRKLLTGSSAAVRAADQWRAMREVLVAIAEQRPILDFGTVPIPAVWVQRARMALGQTEPPS